VTTHELAPGLWYWLAPHPEWTPEENWPEEVPCVVYETRGALVLIDPLLPRGEEDEVLRRLDAAGKPVQVLLTAPWHARGTRDVVDRYGASVWAPPAARWKGPSLQTTSELPEGVEALQPDGDDYEALFFVPEHRTLVTGDVFSGTGGRFHVFVADEVADTGAFLDSLDRLGELPIERVLIAHGEPVLSDGAARIREAVADARSG
jgi:glyoxylase-like metal-dependent hydrolase (beta-lactamase superfamily II)